MAKEVELKPIKISTVEFEEVEKRIKLAFRKLIYEPLIRELKLSLRLKNSKQDLVDALQEGRITFSRGTFRGKFDASISKELRAIGAKWDKITSTYKINLSEIPMDIRAAISSSVFRFQEKLSRIDKKLAQISPEFMAENIKVSDLFDKTLWKVEKEFQKTVKNLTVAPELSETQRAKIAEEWQNNMDLWIKNFTEEHIVELRKTVQDSIFAGNRYETLVKGIKDSYGVTTRKARFLARQETNLLLAKFKETRYTDAGVHEYKWGCVKMPHDRDPNLHVPGNVRFYHGVLEGGVFRWDDPPLTSRNPDKRNNPGQDYNCRCFAIPIVKF